VISGISNLSARAVLSLSFASNLHKTGLLSGICEKDLSSLWLEIVRIITGYGSAGDTALQLN
jgi:hypothetical protein